MASAINAGYPGETGLIRPIDSGAAAVAWPAIFGGAVVAVAITVVFIMVGAGFGLAAVSPFGHNPSAVTFSLVGGLWLIITQWLSSALGGFITGRLRTKWAGLLTHEVFFRDTANGFITWALATLVTLGLVATGLGAMGDHHPRGPHGHMGPPPPEAIADPVSRMLRPAQPSAALPAPEQRMEAAEILATGVTGQMTPDDRSYLSALIVARTGVTAPQSFERIDAAVTQAKQDAESARKAGSATLIFGALSMLAGAFVACVAAAIGGLKRDEYT